MLLISVSFRLLYIYRLIKVTVQERSSTTLAELRSLSKWRNLFQHEMSHKLKEKVNLEITRVEKEMKKKLKIVTVAMVIVGAVMEIWPSIIVWASSTDRLLIVWGYYVRISSSLQCFLYDRLLNTRWLIVWFLCFQS